MRRAVPVADRTILVVRTVEPSWLSRITKLGYRVIPSCDLALLPSMLPQGDEYVVVDASWRGGVDSRSRGIDSLQFQNVERVREVIDVLLKWRPPRAWIGLGSQAEYGNLNGSLSEDLPAQPTDAYGRAKVRIAEMAGESITSVGARFSWLRIFAAYGLGQPAGWLISDALARLSLDQPIILTHALERQDYVWIDDVATACLSTAVANLGGTYNVGTGQSHSVQEVVQTLRHLLGSSSEIHSGFVGPVDRATKDRIADIAMIQRNIGWAPTTTLSEGLGRIARWRLADKGRV